MKSLDVIADDILPDAELYAAPAADTVDDAIRSIESNVANIQPDPAFNIDVTPAEETVDDVLNSFESTQPFTV